VQDARYERLVRHSFCQRALLERAEVFRRNADVDPAVLRKGRIVGIAMTCQFARPGLDRFQLAAFVAYLKLQSLVKGARIASERLWRGR